MSSRSRGRIIILGSIILFTARIGLAAQETTLEELPGLRERAVVMSIISRIVEQNQQVVWDSENTRITIPGRPVGLKLVGADLVVAVLFTPFLRSNGHHVLVAQGQIWINIPDEGISYHTTMQTIPLEFGEQVYFFPLGSMDAKDEASIEIQLVLEPYAGSSGENLQGRPFNPAEGRGEGRQGASERRTPPGSRTENSADNSDESPGARQGGASERRGAPNRNNSGNEGNVTPP